jgi:ketosteroid isomerase-like protein
MRIDLKTLSVIATCVLGVLTLLGSGSRSFAHDDNAPVAPSAKPAVLSGAPDDPREVAERFNRALTQGDAATARALLLPDVLIYESGGIESSAEEYFGHHMPADMAFLANLKRELLSQTSGGDGSGTWVATRSRLSGSHKGKAVDLDSTETLVMRKTPTGWRIAHIHWSSAPHRTSAP